MVQRTTTEARVAKLFEDGGSQAVRLPAECRFDADEVYVTRDEATGDVTLSTGSRRNVWKEFIEYRDSLNIPREDLDNYMAERPMNTPIKGRSVFEDDE